MSSSLRPCFLASGGGTTVEAFLKAIKSGHLPNVRPACVITNNPDAGVITKAQAVGMHPDDIYVVERRDYSTREEWGGVILGICKKHNVNFIGQYGWIPHTPANVVKAFEGRFVNQHPVSLSPSIRGPNGERLDFGGPKMRGQAAIAAALYFAQETNQLWYTKATAHFVTDEIDGGGVIREWIVPIMTDDTVKSLQERILPVEHFINIATMGDFASHGMPKPLHEKCVVDVSDLLALQRAKERAVRDYPNG